MQILLVVSDDRFSNSPLYIFFSSFGRRNEVEFLPWKNENKKT
jgi:hypothetical protein